jgi:hypothetical protein
VPLTSSVRKLALTAHVSSSVGWLGAVTAFLALSIGGVVGDDPQVVRAAYVAMHLVTWFVIVPFSIASLVTGVVQSLGTQWGLFRHYWIVGKLSLTVVATLILLVHTQPIGQVAAVASASPLADADLRAVRIRLIADAGAALMALLVATTLSIYKPWGMTSYGRRVTVIGARPHPEAWSDWRWLWIAGLAVAIAIFLLLHLRGGSAMHGH